MHGVGTVRGRRIAGCAAGMCQEDNPHLRRLAALWLLCQGHDKGADDWRCQVRILPRPLLVAGLPLVRLARGLGAPVKGKVREARADQEGPSLKVSAPPLAPPQPPVSGAKDCLPDRCLRLVGLARGRGLPTGSPRSRVGRFQDGGGDHGVSNVQYPMAPVFSVFTLSLALTLALDVDAVGPIVRGGVSCCSVLHPRVQLAGKGGVPKKRLERNPNRARLLAEQGRRE